MVLSIIGAAMALAMRTIGNKEKAGERPDAERVRVGEMELQAI
jgi:hypothetical protein